LAPGLEFGGSTEVVAVEIRVPTQVLLHSP
jgi:hypothetical protein